MEQTTQLARLGLFDAKVPRYTSYPTAPQFTTDIQATQYAEWLGQIAPESSISLYLHIPFCKRLCWFCACRTQGVNSDEPVKSYLGTLKDELNMVARALPKGVTLARLHWGGGTPTILSPEDMTDLAQAIRQVLPFAKDAEFSVEIDPNEVDDARMDALVGAGMNRVSVGIQDFDEKIQKTIGRDQSFEITKEVIDKLRQRGIQSLNADVLYGLPYQDIASIEATTQKVLGLMPDRVALYGYAHVPWMARRQAMIPEHALPAPVERMALFEAAKNLFLKAGYQGIGIDHFARKGDGLDVALEGGNLRRNFQGYTDDRCDTLIGIGASAISRLPQGYVQNASATAPYLAKIRAGSFAAARGHRFSSEDKLRSRVIEQLMCQFSADLAAIEAELDQVPVNLRPEFAQVHQKYAPYTTLENDRLTLLPEGHALARMVAREFDVYIMNAGSHSLAI